MWRFGTSQGRFNRVCWVTGNYSGGYFSGNAFHDKDLNHVLRILGRLIKCLKKPGGRYAFFVTTFSTQKFHHILPLQTFHHKIFTMKYCPWTLYELSYNMDQKHIIMQEDCDTERHSYCPTHTSSQTQVTRENPGFGGATMYSSCRTRLDTACHHIILASWQHGSKGTQVNNSGRSDLHDWGRDACLIYDSHRTIEQTLALFYS